MPAWAGQNMQEGHPLVSARLGTCLQRKRRTAVVPPPPLSSLTLTFLGLYWSVLTTYVRPNRCSINPNLRCVCVHAQQSRQKQAFFRAAAASRLQAAVWQASLSLQRDCGFRSINNGLHWFTAIGCLCVKTYRRSDVIPQQCSAFYIEARQDKHAPEEPECQSFVFCTQLGEVWRAECHWQLQPIKPKVEIGHKTIHTRLGWMEFFCYLVLKCVFAYSITTDQCSWWKWTGQNIIL